LLIFVFSESVSGDERRCAVDESSIEISPLKNTPGFVTLAIESLILRNSCNCQPILMIFLVRHGSASQDVAHLHPLGIALYMPSLEATRQQGLGKRTTSLHLTK